MPSSSLPRPSTIEHDRQGEHGGVSSHLALLVTLFGRPGAGKTTLGDRLEEAGFLHLALGRMLKDPQTLCEMGIDPMDMARAVAAGRTIHHQGMYDWIDARIASSTTPVVVDGYPRVPAAVPHFARLVESLPSETAVVALILACPELEARRRVVERGRPDDRLVKLDDRYDEFETRQLPLLGMLPERVHVLTVDAGTTPDCTSAAVSKALGIPRLARTGAGA